MYAFCVCDKKEKIKEKFVEPTNINKWKKCFEKGNGIFEKWGYCRL